MLYVQYQCSVANRCGTGLSSQWLWVTQTHLEWSLARWRNSVMRPIQWNPFMCGCFSRGVLFINVCAMTGVLLECAAFVISSRSTNTQRPQRTVALWLCTTHTHTHSVGGSAVIVTQDAGVRGRRRLLRTQNLRHREWERGLRWRDRIACATIMLCTYEYFWPIVAANCAAPPRHHTCSIRRARARDIIAAVFLGGMGGSWVGSSNLVMLARASFDHPVHPNPVRPPLTAHSRAPVLMSYIRYI